MPPGKVKTYEVIGEQAVLGRAKGETLTSADFDSPTQIELLVEGGAIKPVPETITPPAPVASSAGTSTPQSTKE